MAEHSGVAQWHSMLPVLSWPRPFLRTSRTRNRAFHERSASQSLERGTPWTRWFGHFPTLRWPLPSFPSARSSALAGFALEDRLDLFEERHCTGQWIYRIAGSNKTDAPLLH